MTENAEAEIEYVLLDGRKERISAATISHVSVLSDRRGIVYTRAGRVIVVSDGVAVMERWRMSRRRPFTAAEPRDSRP